MTMAKKRLTHRARMKVANYQARVRNPRPKMSRKTELPTSMSSLNAPFSRCLVDGLFFPLWHNCGTLGILGQNEGTQLLEFASLTLILWWR
jgi:hypothetical protein